MDQVSRPYQFALVAVVVLAVAWMLVLKPGDDEAVPPPPAASAPAAGATAPGVTGLGNAVDGAKDAAAAADANTAASQAAAGQVAPATPPVATPPAAAATPAPTAGAPVPAPAADPAAPASESPSAKDPSRLVLGALDKGKVAVVLFHESRGSDDRAVHREVRSVSRRSGRVVVHTIPIGDVGRYGAITRGAQVLSAPTILVIGPDRRARALTGLTDRGEVDELVADVLAEQSAARAAVPSR